MSLCVSVIFNKLTWFRGLVGYGICLTRRTSPVRSWAKSFIFFKFLFLKRLELNNADKYYIVMLYWSLLFSSASSQCLIFIVLRMRIRLSIGFFISNTSEPL